MAFPDIVDFDKLVFEALLDIRHSVQSWLAGRPHDEVALMNHLTGRLARRRRRCDVGAKGPVAVSAEVYALHRQGERATDKYGSDLAVTVRIPKLSWVKTALFQLKRAEGLHVSLPHDQLEQAAVDARILERAFVFVIAEERLLMRVQDVKSLRKQLIGKSLQSTYAFDCSGWSGIVNWIEHWLQCVVGKESEEGDPNSVEALLQSFVVKPPTLDLFPGEDADIPEDFLPARSWLRFTLNAEGPFSDLDL